MSQSVSVIIVHYNSEKETRECLRSLSLAETKKIKLSVVVVDNGSKEIFSHGVNSPRRTEVIRSDANLGFTAGNNLGIKYALSTFQPDYLLLLNSDTLVEPSSVENLVECALAHPRAGVISPKIYFAKGCEYFKKSYSKDSRGQVLWYAGGSMDWLNLLGFHRGVDEVDTGQFDEVQECDFATGCCMLIPSKVIQRVGGFDEKYFLYFEDVALSLKISRAGYEVLLDPFSRIWHKNAGSTGGVGSRTHQYYQTRNRLYFSFKFGTNRVRLTAFKLSLRFLVQGTHIERQATVDFILGRMGKQQI